MKNKILKRCLMAAVALLILTYFVFYFLFSNGNNDKTVCNDVKIVFSEKSANLISFELVENTLKRRELYPVGKNIKEINAEEIEQVLKENKMVKSVECYVTPSGIVYIEIQQRIPKFFVLGKENYYVDEEKTPFKCSSSLNNVPYVPIISGDFSVNFAIGELFDFVSYLEKKQFWTAQIEQIHVRRDKKIELIPRVGESVVLLGNLNNYEKKLEKLKKLYLNVFSEIGWNHYKTINLEYKGQVVCAK